MTWTEVIILSIVEGVTEFLPISSTGHMIIASSILGISDDEFTKLFEICIQLGAILSVVVLYWQKFFEFATMKFYLKLVVAVAPALIFGLLLSKQVDALLESPVTVAVALLLGGIVLLFVDKWFNKRHIDHEHHLPYQKALSIGLWQVLSMIPGTSRAAATIVGGMQQGLTKRFAAEFSFFLAVPTMAAATGYKLLEAVKERPAIFEDSRNIQMLVAGNVIGFFVAMIAIKTFIKFLQKNSFRAFGIYRIIAAAVIFFLIYKGAIITNP